MSSQVVGFGSFLRRAVAALALATGAASVAGAQNAWLWIDRGNHPGHFHRGWFLANGGNAARILLEAGGTSLAQGLMGLGMNDRFYGVAHGVVGACVQNGANQSGGRVSIAGADRRGFAAGTDPMNNCPGGGAPLALPAQMNFTWRMLTCRGAAVPTWMGGISCVQSARNFLGATVTVTGFVPDLQFGILFVVGGVPMMPATKQMMVASLDTWSLMPANNGLTVTDWFDNTAVANHMANLTTLRNGPLAAFNAANGTAYTLASFTYFYNPAIPGTPPALLGPGEEPIETRTSHLCASNGEIGTFCYGDGTASSCPCGNFSAPGANSGCANSLGNAGQLYGTGVASVSADSLVLVGTAMPNAAALYFQGTDDVNDGLGAIFGDGIRCVGGSVIRLGTQLNVANHSQYPEPGDPPVSVAGGCAPGDERFYQIWYRNAASFCTPATFNLTNGLNMIWRP